jgi:hypothetical protein
MASANPSILNPVVVGESFTATVTIEPDMFEIISSVSGSLLGSPLEPGITVTGGTSTVTISGKHEFTFTDIFKYTEPGESDLSTTPTTVVSRGNVPPSKNLFELSQDQRKSETRTYNIIVNGSSTLTVTQEVLNPLEAMRSFMANYNYKGS